MQLPTKSLSFVAAVFALTGGLVASQQPGRHSGMRMYNPSTETTVKGTVDQVTNATRGMMMGTHLSVKTGDEVITVALGPSTFVASSGFAFAKGDAVEITGSKVTMAGEPWIIAREVVKDGKTLTLRDKDGTPKWPRGMMRKSAAATATGQ